MEIFKYISNMQHYQSQNVWHSKSHFCRTKYSASVFLSNEISAIFHKDLQAADESSADINENIQTALTQKPFSRKDLQNAKLTIDIELERKRAIETKWQNYNKKKVF